MTYPLRWARAPTDGDPVLHNERPAVGGALSRSLGKSAAHASSWLFSWRPLTLAHDAGTHTASPRLHSQPVKSRPLPGCPSHRINRPHDHAVHARGGTGRATSAGTVPTDDHSSDRTCWHCKRGELKRRHTERGCRSEPPSRRQIWRP